MEPVHDNGSVDLIGLARISNKVSVKDSWRRAASLSADFSVNDQGNQNRQSVGNLSFSERNCSGGKKINGKEWEELISDRSWEDHHLLHTKRIQFCSSFFLPFNFFAF